MLGYMPSANINYKISSKNSLNFATQHRLLLYDILDDKIIKNYSLSDFTILYTRKLGLASKFSMGLLTRYVGEEWVKRTIQQFGFLYEIFGFKVSNRIRLDQTYKTSGVENRLRFRGGIQIPLKGRVLDNKEFYLKINTEYLNILKENKYNSEFRLSPNVGYVLSNKLKLELGIDSRIGNLINKYKKQSYWFVTGVYYNI